MQNRLNQGVSLYIYALFLYNVTSRYKGFYIKDIEILKHSSIQKPLKDLRWSFFTKIKSSIWDAWQGYEDVPAWCINMLETISHNYSYPTKEYIVPGSEINTCNRSRGAYSFSYPTMKNQNCWFRTPGPLGLKKKTKKSSKSDHAVYRWKAFEELNNFYKKNYRPKKKLKRITRN